jgi:hypothetical protein
MAYIGKTPTVGNFQVCDAISVVNNQAAYTMQVGGVNVSPESANHMLVSLNGILQAPNSSFTVSGSTITFASNLVTGDVIDFIQILGNVLDLGVPSDSTVSLAKLTATGTKNSTTFLRGDNTFAAAGGGKVLQVLTATDSTARSTTSTSFVTASNTLSVDITPSATSSKIFITASFEADSNSSARGFWTIYKDSTNLGHTNGMFSVFSGAGSLDGSSGSLTFLDSPSSTSELTYAVYMKTNGTTCSMNANTVKGSIVVMEIGA